MDLIKLLAGIQQLRDTDQNDWSLKDRLRFMFCALIPLGLGMLGVVVSFFWLFILLLESGTQSTSFVPVVIAAIVSLILGGVSGTVLWHIAQ